MKHRVVHTHIYCMKFACICRICHVLHIHFYTENLKKYLFNLIPLFVMGYIKVAPSIVKP